MQQPSIGRIVLYRLTADEAAEIAHVRAGTHARSGNTVTEGATCPMIVTAVWPDEGGPGVVGLNGQVILDGNDSHWVTSAHEGTAPGTWSWPPRV